MVYEGTGSGDESGFAPGSYNDFLTRTCSFYFLGAERMLFPTTLFSYRRTLAVMVCVLGVSSCFLVWGEESVKPKNSTAAKPIRQTWTTSKVTGSPEPPAPFKVVQAFPKLKFDHPLLMAHSSELKRMFVGEQNGVLYSFPDKPDAKADVFIDLRKDLKTMHLLPKAKEIELLYGLAFHPQFEQNRQCFIAYTLKAKERGQQLENGTRISRFTVTKTDPPRADPASEEIVFTFLQGGHNGCDIHFGPDGMLYISTGDGSGPNPPDPRNTGQDITDLLSSILRIDVDHKDEGKTYGVPKDNPFIKMKDARPEIWAYGFRNPYRMSFDRKTGSLYVGDVGWDLWEMVHRIEKGGNYGWSAMEGPQPIKEKLGPTPIIPPLIALPHTLACSITGGRVYHGKKFPELEGTYIFGDWETRRMWAARFEGDRVKEMPEITRPVVRVVAFGENQDGEIFFLDYDRGTIHTLERNDQGSQNLKFPAKVSETGLFSSVKDHSPAAGVVPFVINARQWQDGATAVHWAAFPGTSGATLYQNGKPIPGFVDWHNFRMHFPKDAVLLRTLSLDDRRIETQIMHYDGLDWHGYSFAWRDDQSDADLVPPDGAEKVLSGRKDERVWQFHSRSQCMSCHNNQTEYAHAFLPAQLNRNGPDGRNQLVALGELGLLRRADDDGKILPAFDAKTAAGERKLVDPHDVRQPLQARARSYLHANCGHCHMEHGGGTVSLRLNENAALNDMKALGVRPVRGYFGLPDARIIQAGDPTKSTLYFRMAKFGRDRMPHIGSDLPDEAGLKLVADWITGLGKNPHKPEMKEAENVDQLLAKPASALLIARKIGQGEYSTAERERILAAASKLPPGPVRELFEGFFPQPDRALRMLGNSPRPSTILAQKGDSARGEKLFWSQTINCAKCHKVGDKGTPAGPDLTTIGKSRSRPELLESMLEPSRRIEPKFAAYIIRTQDGRSITGIVTRRDEKTITLRDGEGKEMILAGNEVEEMKPSRISLMPAGQLASLTAQEAADLLEYLANRK